MKARNKLRTLFPISLIVLTCFFICSCTGIKGYSVVMWNIPEHNLADGTIVPVYIKSNVSHVYVVRLPDSKEKVELPLWQLSEPQSRGKAKKLAQKYKAYKQVYARCALDGLPVRVEKVNTSKQVYRLRKDEILRALYEAEGEAVMTGQSAMEGKWLRVITHDGTQGWCFSYNLRLFKMNADGSVASGNETDAAVEKDDVLEKMLSTKWYPESYSSMIRSGNIDLLTMNTTYGFDTGVESGKVGMHLSDVDAEAEYAGVTKADDKVYKFTDSPFQVTVKSDTYIVVQYTDETGIPKSYNFVSLEDDIESIIAGETDRRSQAYTELRKIGPDFRSTNYGTLTLEENNSFKWSDYNLIVPSVISSDAKESGTVTLKYLLDSKLKRSWDGVLTFAFDGMAHEVSFLYKIESNGLRLEDATNATFEGNTITERGKNALVMFFGN